MATSRVSQRKMRIVYVFVDLIEVNPHQPRKNFTEESLRELAASIEERGVLQPIIVREIANGTTSRYMLIAGERRIRASKLAGKKTIPAIILDVADDEAAEVALLENLQRENLNLVEEARALSALLDRFNGDVDRVASSVHKSGPYVRGRLDLLKLHEQAQGMLERDEINLAQAKVILGIPNGPDQLAAAATAQKLRLNANQLKGRLQHMMAKEGDEHKERKKRASFKHLTSAFVSMFDLLDSADLSTLQTDQRVTLVQQIEVLMAELDRVLEKLNSSESVEVAGEKASE